MDKSDLLPCPYCCKSKPQIYKREGYTGRTNLEWEWMKDKKESYYVQCNGCKARTPFIMNGKDVCIALWNGIAREMNKSNLGQDLVYCGVKIV